MKVFVMNKIFSILESLQENRFVSETGVISNDPLYWEKENNGWLVQQVSGGVWADDSPMWARNTDLEKAFLSKFKTRLESIGKNPKVESSFHFYHGLSRDSLGDVRFTIIFDKFNDEDSKKPESFRNIFSEYDFMKFDKYDYSKDRRVVYVNGYKGLAKLNKVLGFKIKYLSSKSRYEDDGID